MIKQKIQQIDERIDGPKIKENPHKCYKFWSSTQLLNEVQEMVMLLWRGSLDSSHKYLNNLK